MRLSWDEIKRRAKAFSEEWRDAHYEKGETQSFYNDFFDIFGIKRRTVAVYEQRVKLLDNKHGFMDLFWPRTLLIEQKSSRLDLGKAQGQALSYVEGLHPTDQPRWVLTCDFQNWNLLDLETGAELKFHLRDLHKHITAFDFMLGRRVSFENQAGVTIKAAELMGKLHDALEDAGYTGHDLEQFLVRILFCLFADDTGIFQPKDIFLQLIDNDTRPDGSDTGLVLSQLFDVLDTPEGQRQKGLSGELDAFPYVNGQLFAGRLRIPQFDQKMRDHLLDAARHDWSGVSPAIFGSLFQSVMDAKERRAKGAHYTTEANIMKVIGPLFLDDLKDELDRIAARRTGRDAALTEYLAKLRRLTFFDPACGCGNFLVIAYREIRALELRALRLRYPDGGMNAALMSQVTVDQFYGIEFEEFPARIAEVAMWMADHIANNWINEAFNTNIARIPLKGGATILHGDALETDWAELLPPEKCSYIMGNPPFIGQSHQSPFQRQQMARVINAPSGRAGSLDYVTAWFIKAGQYLQPNKRIRVAFVSTNSITQGEQVAQLWPLLFDRYGFEIAFAHRTFNWGSEARGKAHVHVVIIGLAHRDHEPAEKRLFSYPDINGDPVESRHGALTAYLFDAKGLANRHLVVRERAKPLADIPPIIYGNKPVDNGNLIFDTATKEDLVRENPDIAKFIRFLVSSHEYLNGGERWCLWLNDVEPSVIRQLPVVTERIKAVRAFRLSSKKIPTQKAAAWASLFAEIRQPTSIYILVPRHSSENREYIPFGFFDSKVIVHDSCTCIPDGEIFHFGIISSKIHTAWLSYVGGRIKSDYRYSNTLVYNTFPWPDATPAQRAKIETLAQAVLDARAAHPTSSLADLYDPDTMPGNLRKAHAALDLAVDKLYRAAPFASDRDRVEHLFGRYEALVNPLEREAAKQNRRVARKAAKQG
ncbi:MAG: N-6 DNA methylase [Sphingopyxis sp.]